eukprot:1066154-Rhodomonas_salina.1
MSDSITIHVRYDQTPRHTSPKCASRSYITPDATSTASVDALAREDGKRARTDVRPEVTAIKALRRMSAALPWTCAYIQYTQSELRKTDDTARSAAALEVLEGMKVLVFSASGECNS